MTNNFQEEISSFKGKKQKIDHRSSLPTILYELDISEIVLSCEKEREAAIRQVEKELKAERIKGQKKHWSYDLNRHIALKHIRDKLIKRDKIV